MNKFTGEGVTVKTFQIEIFNIKYKNFINEIKIKYNIKQDFFISSIDYIITDLKKEKNNKKMIDNFIHNIELSKALKCDILSYYY